MSNVAHPNIWNSFGSELKKSTQKHFYGYLAEIKRFMNICKAVKILIKFNPLFMSDHLNKNNTSVRKCSLNKFNLGPILSNSYK